MINDGTYRYRPATMDDLAFVREAFADRPDRGLHDFSDSGIEAMLAQDIESRLPEVFPITADSSWRGMNIFERMPNEPISVGRFIVDATLMHSVVQQMHPDHRGGGLWGAKLTPLGMALVFLVYQADVFQWQITKTITPMFEWSKHGTEIGTIAPEHTEAGSEQVLGQESREQWRTRVGDAAHTFTIEG